LEHAAEPVQKFACCVKIISFGGSVSSPRIGCGHLVCWQRSWLPRSAHNKHTSFPKGSTADALSDKFSKDAASRPVPLLLRVRFASLSRLSQPIPTGHELAISVLDLMGMRAGEPTGSAMARSVDLAQHVEQWDVSATGWQSTTPFLDRLVPRRQRSSPLHPGAFLRHLTFLP
jgi:hypothetical protein